MSNDQIRAHSMGISLEDEIERPAAKGSIEAELCSTIWFLREVSDDLLRQLVAPQKARRSVRFHGIAVGFVCGLFAAAVCVLAIASGL